MDYPDGVKDPLKTIAKRFRSSGERTSEFTPKVSVIVPAKNAAPYLGACLDSIRSQSLAELECVVVDDGSSDDTARIAQRVADVDTRVSLISHVESRGPSAARNTGITNSSAPFVTFLDADDFLYPESIQLRVEALENADPEVVAASYCDWQPTPEDQGQEPPERAPANRSNLGFVHGPECPFIVTAPVVRRRALERVGGFNESLRTAEDFDLWVRILRNGHTFTYVPIIGVAYRQNSTSLMFSESAGHAEASMSVMDWQYEDLSASNDAPVLSRPVSYYQLECAKARRLLRTYALAAACGHHEGVDRIGRLLRNDLHALIRAGLDVENELRGGAWRASNALPELQDGAAQERLVQTLATQLRERS